MPHALPKITDAPRICGVGCGHRGTTRSRFASLCAAALLLMLHGEAFAQHVLRWRFEPGQEFLVHFEQQAATQSSGAGKPNSLTLELHMDLVWQVEQVQEDGTAQMTQRIGRLIVKMKSGVGEPITFDSAETNLPAASAELAAALRPLVGAEFRLQMTDRGTIRDVVLPDATVQGLEQAASPSLKQLFTPESISSILGQSAIELPADAVGPGDTWTAVRQMETPLGPVTLEQRFVLREPEELDRRLLEKITFTAELRGGANRSPEEQLRVLSHEQTGTLLFDNRAGRLVRGESRQKLVTERQYREFKINVETNSSSAMTVSVQGDPRPLEPAGRTQE